MHATPTHLCFLNTQHVCFGLVLGPESEPGFVNKEMLGWARMALWTQEGG